MGNANAGKKGDQADNGKNIYIYIDDKWLFCLKRFIDVFKH